MIARVKAKFTNGHIVPLERLDIEEGAELSVDIDIAPSRSDQERMPGPGEDAETYDPETPSINDIFDDIRKSLSHIPKEPGPTDGAKNYKHYLYGRPKED